MSQPLSTRTWFPDNKRSDVEFFKKLHMLRDDLHLQERENMKSAVARIESKKHGRRKPSVERDKNDNVRNLKMKFNTSISNVNNGPGVRMWKDSCFIEVRDVTLRPWDTVHELNYRMPYESLGERLKKDRLQYNIKKQSMQSSRQSKSVTAGQIRSDTAASNSTDVTIARLAMTISDVDGYNSHDFMRIPDHLPTIPSIGHRLPISHNNRIKAMTWESEFCEPVRTKKKEIGAKTKLLTSKAQQEAKNTRKQSANKRKHEGLRFDVNLHDKDVFKFLNSEVMPSTPRNPLFPGNIGGSDSIPLISLSGETDNAGGDNLDSSRGGGLQDAMRRLLSAQENLEGLKEELQSIAHLNDQLENFKDVDDDPSETVE